MCDLQRHNEENPDNPPLFGRIGVEPKVLVYLVAGDNDGRPHTQGCDALTRQRLEGRMKSSKMNEENLGHLHKCGIPIASGLVQGRC